MQPQQKQPIIYYPSWKAKFFGTVSVVAISGFWYILMVAIFWETVSLRCQPNPTQIICKISGEPYPGGTRNFEIPKAQLSGVKIIHALRKPHNRQIILTSIDQKEISLTRTWGGDVNLQLEKQIDKIKAFIADPQAQTLSVETHRNFPVLSLLMTVGIVWFNGLLLKRLWLGYREQ